MFPDQGSCSRWRNQLHSGENSGSRFIFPHFQKNNSWFNNNRTLNSPTFKTNNINLTNLSMKQHQTRQLFNGATLILPAFQWNNADLANQPLSILSFFLQTKRNCWTCFFPDSRQCCTMGKTPSCLLLILALDKKVCFQYCTHTSERRKSNRKKL